MPTYNPAALTLTGARPQAGAGAYGSVPQAPNPTATTLQAIQGNIAAMNPLQTLARRTNVFQQNQLLQGYRAALPQYDTLTATSSGNILANLRGELTPDIMRQFQQDAAERGVGRGIYTGSGNLDSSYLTNVLRNRLQLQALGEQQLGGAMSRAPVATPFQTASYYTSPQDMYAAQMGANVLAASPSPAAAARAQEQAALRGLRAGAGAGGGGGGGSRPAGGGSQNISDILSRYLGVAGGGPTVITGPQDGGTPTSTFNWMDWAQSLPGQTTGENAYYYAGANPTGG